VSIRPVWCRDKRIYPQGDVKCSQESIFEIQLEKMDGWAPNGTPGLENGVEAVVLNQFCPVLRA